ncbi:MAG TPA: hypothetical protein VGL56_21005 [Fimbriimonadaceae bacterium]
MSDKTALTSLPFTKAQAVAPTARLDGQPGVLHVAFKTMPFSTISHISKYGPQPRVPDEL